jgi:hypothetical protein
MSDVWSHKFDYHQHHNHALYAYLHVNTCVITFLYKERKERVYYMLGGNWTLVLSLLISFFLQFRSTYWSEQNEWAKVCKVMTRSCTFQALVYVYASNIEWRKERRREISEKERGSERVRQCNHYHTVDCHAKGRRTITKTSSN